MPWVMLNGLSPMSRRARGSISSARRFRICQWLSLTTTSSAPASNAAATAAFASPAMSERERS